MCIFVTHCILFPSQLIFCVSFHMQIAHCKKMPLDATLFFLRMTKKYTNWDWLIIYDYAICIHVLDFVSIPKTMRNCPSKIRHFCQNHRWFGGGGGGGGLSSEDPPTPDDWWVPPTPPSSPKAPKKGLFGLKMHQKKKNSWKHIFAEKIFVKEMWEIFLVRVRKTSKNAIKNFLGTPPPPPPPPTHP